MTTLEAIPTVRSAVVVHAAALHLPVTVLTSRARRCRRVLVWAVAAILLVNCGFAMVLEHGPPRLRDPEYGKRISCIQSRVATSPSRPLVVVIGSSRTAMGIRPDAYEAEFGSPHAPLLMNASRVGAGPILQLLTLRRLLADGVKPDRVLLEYWPPLLRGDGIYREELRIDTTRLTMMDEPVIRGYFADPELTLGRIQQARVVPLYSYRRRVLDQWLPDWLPHSEQTRAAWESIDEWGWLPGRESATQRERDGVRPAVASFYVPLYVTYEVTPIADRALRDCLDVCKSHGIAVSLMTMPEASWFDTMKTAQAVQIADAHLAKLIADTGINMIDGRTWATDDYLPDGFHLTRNGAASFTRKLGEVVLGN